MKEDEGTHSRGKTIAQDEMDEESKPLGRDVDASPEKLLQPA